MKSRRNNGSKAPRFVALYEWEMDLPAWRLMSPNARCLVLELRRKYNGHNNGQIVMSVREAGRLLKCHRDTAQKALAELRAKGWALPDQIGYFSQKTNKTATLWRITNQAVGMGVDAPETKEYARWKPDADEPPEKQNTVLTIRTACLKNQDRDRKYGPKYQDRTPPNCPKNQDRDYLFLASDGPKNQDTSNLAIRSDFSSSPSTAVNDVEIRDDPQKDVKR